MKPTPRLRSTLCRRVVALVLCGGIFGAAAPAKKSSDRVVRPTPMSTGVFELQVARQYEDSGRWKEAQQEYLQAGRAGPSCVRKAALAAIERLHPHYPPDDDNFEFELGELYGREHDWKTAEQHYAAAAKGGTSPFREKAIRGIKEAREHQRVEEWKETLDRWLGYAARILALFLLLVVLPFRIFRIRRAIEVLPLETSDEASGKRLLFSLSAAREDLAAGLRPPGLLPLPLADSIALAMLPGVENELVEPLEDLEIGEVKLPLATFIRFFRRPRVRVRSRWNVGVGTGTARARIFRRAFSGYRQEDASDFAITSAAGAAQDTDLMLFSYDVLVKAVYLNES